MKTIHMNGIKILLVVIGALVMSLSPAAAALAGGNGATTFHETYHNTQDQFVDYIPCLGVLGDITTTYNGAANFTVNKAGDFWGTVTETGSVVAVPLDSSLPTYSGHFTLWFGQNDNLRNGNETNTFMVNLTGSDGSKIKFVEVAHVTLNANGDITSSFDKASCGG